MKTPRLGYSEVENGSQVWDQGKVVQVKGSTHGKGDVWPTDSNQGASRRLSVNTTPADRLDSSVRPTSIARTPKQNGANRTATSVTHRGNVPVSLGRTNSRGLFASTTEERVVCWNLVRPSSSELGLAVSTQKCKSPKELRDGWSQPSGATFPFCLARQPRRTSPDKCLG